MMIRITHCPFLVYFTHKKNLYIFTKKKEKKRMEKLLRNEFINNSERIIDERLGHSHFTFEKKALLKFCGWNCQN